MIYNFPDRTHYNVHKLIFDLRNSKELRVEFEGHKDELMDKYQLTPEEIRLLLDGDPIEMYNFGIFPYLLHYYWTTIVGSSKKGIDALTLYKGEM